MQRKYYIKPIAILVCIICVCAILTYLYLQIPNDAPNADSVKDLQASAGHVFTDLQGTAITFEPFEGKVRVVNSWASWTPFSVQELRDLEQLASEVSKDEVAVLAINRKEPKEMAIQFLGTIFKFENITFMIDVSDYFYNSVGGFAMPETIFYDKKGSVVYHARGSLTLEQMRLHTKEAIDHVQ